MYCRRGKGFSMGLRRCSTNGDWKQGAFKPVPQKPKLIGSGLTRQNFACEVTWKENGKILVSMGTVPAICNIKKIQYLTFLIFKTT